MKIAFEVAGGDAWKAGISYPNCLYYAVKQTYGDVIKSCLLNRSAHQEVPTDLFGDLLEVVDIPRSRRWSERWRGTRLMRRSGIDVIFGLLLRHRHGNIANFSWIPDFQHLRLPDMFSAAERGRRDLVFRRTAKISHRIILMSEEVMKDFQQFLPAYAAKGRVLSPVYHVPAAIYDANPQTVLNVYQLPERFVYFPSQFWKHKNHETFFKAIKLLNGKGMRVFVVCTGYLGDYRHPNYFGELCQKVSHWGIRDQVAFLGLVSREVLLLLIRQAVCVTNPSLFEGFGLTVEEARSVGKQLLLSDIPTHREQNPPKAVFFDPRNCEDLAAKLSAIWTASRPGPDAELESCARSDLSSRLRASAESFRSVLLEVV